MISHLPLLQHHTAISFHLAFFPFPPCFTTGSYDGVGTPLDNLAFTFISHFRAGRVLLLVPLVVPKNSLLLNHGEVAERWQETTQILRGMVSSHLLDLLLLALLLLYLLLRRGTVLCGHLHFQPASGWRMADGG